MNNPKRHHYVPQLILRRFADDAGKLFFFDKRRPEDGIKSSTIGNLFVENYLYSIKEESGDKDATLETELASLEGAAEKIIKKIENATLVNKVPQLSSVEKKLWDFFFYIQWKRTPDNFAKIFSEIDFEITLREAIKDFEQRLRPLTSEQRKELENPIVLKRIKHNAKANAIRSDAKDVLDVIGNKGLAIIRIGALNKSFIIGSYPIVKLTLPGRSHLSDPTVEVWFPISPRVAISPAYLRGECRVIPIKSVAEIRHINVSVAKQSTIIASKSEKLISSLLKQR
ncbi:MAG: DUF4238 domain-containing protein [Rhodospirillaceae bacterium]